MYVTVAVPEVDPVTTPPTTETLPLPAVVLHVPPPVTLLNEVVNPWHTLNVPNIADAAGFTVTILVT